MKTKHIFYQPQGVCSQMIDVTADENDVIQQVMFLGGCMRKQNDFVSRPIMPCP